MNTTVRDTSVRGREDLAPLFRKGRKPHELTALIQLTPLPSLRLLVELHAARHDAMWCQSRLRRLGTSARQIQNETADFQNERKLLGGRPIERAGAWLVACVGVTRITCEAPEHQE